MGWTLPRTWVVGEIVTAVQLNTHIRDNLSSGPIAATISALNALFPGGTPAAGARGTVYVGSGNFESVHLIYDATNTRWVTNIQTLISSAGSGSSDTANVWQDIASVVIPYGQFATMGLALQVRAAGIANNLAAGTLDIGVQITPYAHAGAAGTASIDAVQDTTTSVTAVALDTGWFAPTFTSNTEVKVSMRVRNSVNNNMNVVAGTVLARWVG